MKTYSFGQFDQAQADYDRRMYILAATDMDSPEATGDHPLDQMSRAYYAKSQVCPECGAPARNKRCTQKARH